MASRILLILYLLTITAVARALTPGGDYSLGTGLLELARTHHVLQWTDTVPVYRDTGLTQLQTQLTVAQTNCPQCMACAEPNSFYEGPFQPFQCGGGNGPAFICTRVTPRYFEILADTTGARAYIPAAYGRYASWEQYLLAEAAAGEYFRIVRQWDTSVLYDKPYPEGQLPAADKYYCAGVKLVHPDDLKFVPVAVQGHWVKLNAMRNKRLAGYCWVIWRDERRLYHWFAWNAD
ncbi:hypothetical protein [Taibaiella chishuiensis]|uniref:WG repeat protein n=1 Tax=Taibaiella chishuiensis TaxID=1434707 RepID=A0A2P8CV35_9BACT|nr:hypothetical protein [Taibaiella chishuiensis]PSK88817.1 hypothetical protein B0I18_11428 [Taibaiella chishuiensis]